MTVSIVDATLKERPTRELIFEFLRGHDRVLCELVDHGQYGVEAQILINEELVIGRTFHQRLDPARTPKAMATAWAEAYRNDKEPM